MAFAKKTPGNRWRGIAKDGRTELGSKTFDLRREAVAWAERQEAAAAGGVDVKAGKARLKTLLPEWAEEREGLVAPATSQTDSQMVRLIPPWMTARTIASLTSRDIEKWMAGLRKQEGLGDASIRRYRASLAVFFAWAVSDGRRSDNPVTLAKAPMAVDEEDRILPFSESELESVLRSVGRSSEHYARIIHVLAWTGLRWGEARALRVSDVTFGSRPSITVSRSQSEGAEVKTVKGRRSRLVPMPDHVAVVIAALASGKGRHDRILTSPTGSHLWKSRFGAPADWKAISGGRSIHDLRHTAATLWLSRGVDLMTVSAWLGHASVTTTNRYLHHLGTASDHAAVGLLSARGAPGGRKPKGELPALPDNTEGFDVLRQSATILVAHAQAA